MQAEKAWKFNLEHGKDKFVLQENLAQKVVKMLFIETETWALHLFVAYKLSVRWVGYALTCRDAIYDFKEREMCCKPAPSAWQWRATQR